MTVGFQSCAFNPFSCLVFSKATTLVFFLFIASYLAFYLQVNLGQILAWKDIQGHNLPAHSHHMSTTVCLAVKHNQDVSNLLLSSNI